MNLNDEAILQTAANVALSVQVAVDYKSDGAARLQAHQFYEEFRNKATPMEFCAVGFVLCGRSEDPVILSGLQMIGDVARYNWNTLTDRQAVKDRLLQLMHNGLNSGSTSCPSYLEEAFCKVIVEIAKREWPQLWPDLFPKLFEMANASDLALRVLRRMAEDVVTLQLVDCSERKRELSQSLTTIAPDVISTLFNVLISSVKEYNTSHTDTLRRRGKVCLGCLLPYIEWQNPLVFTLENRLIVLFALLPEKEFQLEAADCLVQLLERKPLKKEDKYIVPKICLDNACCTPLLKCIDDFSDNLDFIRKVGEILTLIAPYVAEGQVTVENFFNCILKLASKPQAVAVLGSAFAINQYLKAQNSSADLTDSPVGKALICALNAICAKFVSAPPTVAEKEELSRLKTEFSQMLRTVGKYLPKLYKEVNSWLHSSLINPNTVQIYQWEILVLVIDGVASSISHEDKDMINIGLRDLEQCYNKFKEETVLELKSIILSTVSALFVFLSLAKQGGSFGETHLTFMHSILESVFLCFNYDNVPYARDIRRHAAALMIKLSTKLPDLMVLAFNFIHSATVAAAPKMSSMEYTALMESLLITCNSWNDPIKQSAFIRSLLNQAELSEISTSSESVAALVKNLQESVFQDKRILFVKNLTLLYSVVRRVKKASKSNGILQQSHVVENSNSTNAFNAVGHTDSESQHPAFDVICPVLPTVFKLVKTLHSVLDDPQLAFLMDLNEQERSHIMGIHFSGGGQTAAGEPLPPSVAGTDNEKSHPEKLKQFTQTLLDLTYGILGGAPYLFSPKFYYIPQVAEAYLSFVGWNNTKMTDFRLRGVIRSVFSPFVVNCPLSQFDAVVKPFLQNFGPFMLERMITRWSAIENANNSGGDAEDQEVLENTSLRLLSKDYIDLLHKLMEMRACHVNIVEGEGDGMGAEKNDINNSSNSQSQQSGSNEPTPGDFGQLLLEDPSCFQAVIQLCIHALCWDDSNLCLKSSRCILLSWRKLVEQPDLVITTFGTTLRALCVWYENEANMDCLIKVLDLVFKSCYQTNQRLVQLLKEWGANEQDVHRMIALCNGPKNDKKRKDLYRKMVFNNPAVEINRSPKAQWLRGLPQLQPAKPKDSKPASSDIDLSECFSFIHQS